MNYYENIKEKLINNEINKKIKDYSKNKYELQTYYDVGKLLIDAQGGEKRAKYGNKLIKEYSIKLTNELGKNVSITNLKYMRQFYEFSKSHSLSDQLTFTHYKVLFALKNSDSVEYYINISITDNLSVRQLQERIKSKEYERLTDATKEKLKQNKKLEISDSIKNPILIKNSLNVEKISEKILQRLIIEDVQNIMKQLGDGFSFIDNEYKIKIGNTYNYIDLLLYNYIYKSFVVIELKITELKKEHIGQIQVYMNYIDENLKQINDNKTIGIIIVKENNDYIIKYSSDKRIITTKYILI